MEKYGVVDAMYIGGWFLAKDGYILYQFNEVTITKR